MSETSDMPAVFPFDHGASVFSGPVVYGLACVSALSYREPESVVRCSAQWGMSATMVDLAAYDVQVLLLEHERLAILGYRGTQPKVAKDWLSDLDFDHVAGPFGARAHHGFLRGADSVMDHVCEFARAAQARDAQLWITGHSLGAAMATLTAARLVESGDAFAGVVNFGSPRVGNADFSAAYDEAAGARTLRVVNNADIVPRVPPRVLGFRHAGQLLHFDRDGVPSRDGSRWAALLDRLGGPVDKLFEWGAEGVEDHFVAHYVALTAAQAQIV